jgi:myosin V
LLTLPSQTKTIDAPLSALQDDQFASKLPPLMNPTMLEASDDLTNLSHLNEPAGWLLPELL